MFIHSVYFWLKQDLSPEDRGRFKDGLDSLRSIESIRRCFIGTPADTNRPVIDTTYSYALTTVFDDRAGHDYYQDHEAHDRFRNECSAYWTRVLIYDSVE